METPFDQLRNKLTPVFNYFKMLETCKREGLSLDHKRKLNELIEKEEDFIIHTALHQIRKILDENV